MVGTGVDSPMWALLNRCGRTVFVEASQQFADIVCGWVPHAEMLVYNDYRTTVASIPEVRGAEQTVVHGVSVVVR